METQLNVNKGKSEPEETPLSRGTYYVCVGITDMYINNISRRNTRSMVR